MSFSRNFQHTPKGTYPRPESPTVYVPELFSFGGERGCPGYAKQGYVGVLGSLRSLRHRQDKVKSETSQLAAGIPVGRGQEIRPYIRDY